MYKTNEIEFEKFLLLLFAVLCFINIIGTNNIEKYIKTNDNKYINKSNNIFLLTLIIYIYFFIRNFNEYQNSKEKEKKDYRIKVIGSSFLIAGILCLLYFQSKQHKFIGTTAP